MVDRAEGGADAEAEEHVPKLRDGRVRHHALDVVLRHADRRREERRAAADPRHRGQRERMQREERIQARDEVDAGGDHRRRVDERRHRGRAFHRVGKPHIQRELGALAERAEHEAVGDRGLRPLARATGGGGVGCERLEQRVVGHRVVVDPDQEDRERKPEVADPVHDERLLRGGHRGRPRVVVADEQVAREADAFPAEVQEDEVAAHHERAHREEEDAHRAEEARVALADIGLHVLGRVDRDQRAEARDEQHPQQRERVDVERERSEEGVPLGGAFAEPGERDPLEEVHGARRVVGARPEQHEGRRERGDQRDRGDRARQLALHAEHGANAAQDRGHGREEQDEARPREFRRRDGGRNLLGRGHAEKRWEACGDHGASEFRHVDHSVLSRRRASCAQASFSSDHASESRVSRRR